jgi:hypothetical protein
MMALIDYVERFWPLAIAVGGLAHGVHLLYAIRKTRLECRLLDEKIAKLKTENSSLVTLAEMPLRERIALAAR